MEQLSLVGGLIAAIAALSGAVGILWRDGRVRYESLERRTESHLAVNTEQLKALLLVESELRAVVGAIDHVSQERAGQIAALANRVDDAIDLMRGDHTAQLAALAAIQSKLNGR